MKKVITFGTFDLFHLGHLNVLRRAKALGNHLIVGVSSDELNVRKKHVRPTYPIQHRLEIVKAIRYVDEVFVEESLEEKRKYINEFGATILVMGDDWEGKFDYLDDVCRIVYLPRTEGISSTEIKINIRSQAASSQGFVGGVMAGYE